MTNEPPPMRDDDDDQMIGSDADGLASVILVDRLDDVAAICGRVDTAPTFAVVVSAPDGNRPLASELGMRRLQRHAEESGKVVAIATRSMALANRARQVGIPVARRPEHVRWDAAGKRVVRLGRKSLAIPNLGGWLQVIAIFAILGAFAGLALTMAPSADVTIVPPTETLTENVTVQVSEDFDGIDLGATPFQVPATRVTTTRTMTLAVKTTGTAMVGTTPALVLVTMTNTGAREVVIPEGTVLHAGPNKLEFRIDQETTIPAGQAAIQQASARVPGTGGNVAAATVTAWADPQYASVTVTNPAAAAGGASEERQAVGAADLTALSQLARDLERSETLKQSVLEGRTHDAVFIRTAETTVTPGDVSATAGTPADLVLMDVEVRVTALAVLEATLEEVALSVLGAQQGIGEFVPGSVSAVETGARELDPETNIIRTDLRLSGMFARNVTRDAVKDAVKGRSEEGAQSTLAERYGIQDAQVDLSPGWAPWLPRFDFRIDVTLLTEPLDTGDDASGDAATNGTATATPTTPRP
ncbi:MAG: baseplate J/gp47 family protein [Dehalococcoidia bacterium]|nr:baseplate J/gp47 family protein [Dehalococcoidia bacterium]